MSELGNAQKISQEKESNTEIVYGDFFAVSEKEIKIMHEPLIDTLRKHGFIWLKINGVKRLVKVQGKIVHTTDIIEICDFIRNYINTVVPEFLGHGFKRAQLLNLFVRGIDNYINHSKLRMLDIKELNFQRDTKTSSYFYFENKVVKVDAERIVLLDYDDLDGYVWKKQIRGRKIELGNLPDGEFKEFCFRVCNRDEKKFDSLKSIIGYTLHRYWSPAKTKVPCLLDETINGTEQAQGGTGKTIICQALGEIRNMAKIDGKSFKPNSSFPYQQVDMDTEIIFIDDLDRNISFEFCFSLVSMGLEINHKNKAAFRIPVEDTPKLIMTSNFPIRSIPGNSTERRKFEFEVSSYYGAERDIVTEFGHEFFQDWTDKEYNDMFNFFLECSQVYLKSGLVIPPEINATTRRLINDLGGPDLKDFLDEKVRERKERWVKKDLYDEFIKSHYGLQKYYPSQNKFTMRVTKYLDHRRHTDGLEFDSTAMKRKAFQLDYSALPDEDFADDP